MACVDHVCIPLLALALVACSDDETTAPATATWQQLEADLPGALISVWGSSTTDVWAVGGDAGDGPMIIHRDGDSWTRLESGTSGDLWWVFGFEGGPVFMGGAGGVLLRHENGSFTTMTTPGTGTVFGIWGTSPDDLWAVGGAGDSPSGGFIWRLDGSSWVDEPLAPASLASSATVFKVWGASADDVWMVGTAGLTMHYDGTSITEVESPAERPLFTVHGDLGKTYAVGGFQSGIILELDGDSWLDATPTDAPQMTGIFCRGDKTYAAGVFGNVMRREPAGWVLQSTGLEIREDFHSVWIDPDGGVYAVGGQISSSPFTDGMMIYLGEGRPPTGVDSLQGD